MRIEPASDAAKGGSIPGVRTPIMFAGQPSAADLPSRVLANIRRRSFARSEKPDGPWSYGNGHFTRFSPGGFGLEKGGSQSRLGLCRPSRDRANRKAEIAALDANAIRKQK